MSFNSRMITKSNLKSKGRDIKNAFGQVRTPPQYDIPLNKSQDTKFLTFLIALMSMLLSLSFAGAIALDTLTKRWSSGLENKLTIEIPVKSRDGTVLSQDKIEKEKRKIREALDNHSAVRNISIMDQNEIRTLLSPWINENMSFDDIPMPGLITIELIENSDLTLIEALEKDLKALSPHARLETHEEWLADVLQFIKTIETLSLLITVLVTVITVAAITTGIRTRMIIHKKEIELLHHMGATANYIAKQFQKHAFWVTLKGAFTGTLISIVILIMIALNMNISQNGLLPETKLTFQSTLMLLTIPVTLSALAILTTRLTLLNSLSKMP